MAGSTDTLKISQLLFLIAYPTWSFEGSKFVFLSTTSWMGGKNPFLGVAYLLVGSLCIVLGIIFLVIHLNFDRRLSFELIILIFFTLSSKVFLCI